MSRVDLTLYILAKEMKNAAHEQHHGGGHAAGGHAPAGAHGAAAPEAFGVTFGVTPLGSGL